MPTIPRATRTGQPCKTTDIAVHKNKGGRGATHCDQLVWTQSETKPPGHASTSKIVLLVAIVTLHWIVLCCTRQQGGMPLRATIIGFAAPGAIAPRDELTQELVATSTLPF